MFQVVFPKILAPGHWNPEHFDLKFGIYTKSQARSRILRYFLNRMGLGKLLLPNPSTTSFVNLVRIFAEKSDRKSLI